MNADEKPSTPERGREQRDRDDSPVDPREPALRAAFERMRDAMDELERAVLLSLTTPNRTPATLPLVRRDVMKPREYAEYMRVNVRKVHGWIRTGMPHFLVENRIRIRVADADGWLQAQATAKKDKPSGAEPSQRKTVRTRKPKVSASRQAEAGTTKSTKKPTKKPKSKRNKPT